MIRIQINNTSVYLYDTILLTCIYVRVLYTYHTLLCMCEGLKGLHLVTVGEDLYIFVPLFCIVVTYVCTDTYHTYMYCTVLVHGGTGLIQLAIRSFAKEKSKRMMRHA